MKIGVDTNVLVYAVGFDSEDKQSTAIELLTRLDPQTVLVPVFVLAELHYVISRKLRDKRLASKLLRVQASAFDVIGSTALSLSKALDLVDQHDLQIFDAIILAECTRAGCRILLTEDGQHGFEKDGCTLIDPFKTPMHPLLAEALTLSAAARSDQETDP